MFLEWYPFALNFSLNPSLCEFCHNQFARMRILFRCNPTVHYPQARKPSVHTLNFAAIIHRIRSQNWRLLEVNSSLTLLAWLVSKNRRFARHCCNLHIKRTTSFFLFGTHWSTSDHDLYCFSHFWIESRFSRKFKFFIIISEYICFTNHTNSLKLTLIHFILMF